MATGRIGSLSTFQNSIFQGVASTEDQTGKYAYWTTDTLTRVYILSSDIYGNQEVRSALRKDYDQFPHIRAQAHELCKQMSTRDIRMVTLKRTDPTRERRVRCQLRKTIAQQMVRKQRTAGPISFRAESRNPHTPLPVFERHCKMNRGVSVKMLTCSGKRRPVLVNNQLDPFIQSKNPKTKVITARCIPKHQLDNQSIASEAERFHNSLVNHHILRPIERRANVSCLIKLFEAESNLLHADRNKLRTLPHQQRFTYL